MKPSTFARLAGFAVAVPLLASVTVSAPAAVRGWLNWRGPDQNGTTRETGLPDKVDAKAPLWTADFPGQSSPVIADGRLYINGFLGEGADRLQPPFVPPRACGNQRACAQPSSSFLGSTPTPR